MNRTTLIINYWWTFALPLVCLCSIVTSWFSLLVLHKLRHLNRLYRLLYVKALINLVYLSICFWIFLVKCGVATCVCQRPTRRSAVKSTKPTFMAS